MRVTAAIVIGNIHQIPTIHVHHFCCIVHILSVCNFIGVSVLAFYSFSFSYLPLSFGSTQFQVTQYDVFESLEINAWNYFIKVWFNCSIGSNNRDIIRFIGLNCFFVFFLLWSHYTIVCWSSKSCLHCNSINCCRAGSKDGCNARVDW